MASVFPKSHHLSTCTLPSPSSFSLHSFLPPSIYPSIHPSTLDTCHCAPLKPVSPVLLVGEACSDGQPYHLGTHAPHQGSPPSSYNSKKAQPKQIYTFCFSSQRKLSKDQTERLRVRVRSRGN
ncbi:unnamed protein product [Nyctereutes procyonoides]|uniref:(raccoon dog) hypothetical protein n=1 Tax=Nyctereutes procyonoides TaxID=34880 RepID=A0A811Z1M5_NYCPR|nr:unnamed protein product [Nyctereutes procyonoides]